MSTFNRTAITPQRVALMFPATPGRNIRTHLPYVVEALDAEGLCDRDMVLMALATIAAETEGFEPISEGKSRYNTAPGGEPFALYDGRRDLGNLAPGDGARFKGRGYIQITGRDNYRRIGTKIGVDLTKDPALANDPTIAAKILAAYLKSKETKIRVALAKGDLAAARKLVNGGRHGLERFSVAFAAGDRVFPR